MANLENKSEESNGSPSEPVPQAVLEEPELSRKAVEEGQKRETYQRLAALEEEVRQAQVDQVAVTPNAPADSGSSTPTAQSDKPKDQSAWAALLSGLSAAWSQAGTWLEELGSKVNEMIKDLLGTAEKKPDGYLEDDKETVEDALDMLWPDAPIFSFPKNYAGPIDVSDVMRWRKNHSIHGYGRMHNGMDIPAPKGTPILLAADEAEVITSKFQETVNPESGKKDGAGHYVKIRMPNGLVATFMHLNEAGPVVGTKLKKGQVLGYVGETGGASGPHIHYEITSNGERVDPTPYLAAQLRREAEEEKEEKGVA